MPKRTTRRSFGALRKLPSGRWQASYVGPDLIRHNAPMTFETQLDAEIWLVDRRREVKEGEWEPPLAETALTFREFAGQSLASRNLKPRTRAHYEKLLEDRIFPAFGDRPLRVISFEEVDAWYASLNPKTPTMNAHCYGLLRSIFLAAEGRHKIKVNPCNIKGASNSRRTREPIPATIDELEALTAATPEEYQLMVLLAAWCALRFGEVTALTRSDVDVKNLKLRVRVGVTWVKGKAVLGDPKSQAGKRPVSIPPHLKDSVKRHLKLIPEGSAQLLFPSPNGSSERNPLGHMTPSEMGTWYRKARAAANRNDLRFHDLRHTGAVLAAATGATLAEMMVRLGHSTPGAAMRYQHAAKDRDTEIAELMSKLIESRSLDK